MNPASIFPGWDSVEAATKWHRWFEIAGFIALGLLLIFEIISYIYGSRKDILLLKQEEVKEKMMAADIAQANQAAQTAKEAQERSEKSLKELESRTPLPVWDQPIVSATATIKVVISSTVNMHANFMDSGGFLGLGKGSTAILLTSAAQSQGMQTGSGTIVFTGVFTADQSQIPSGQIVSVLFDADYIQIYFAQMPEKSPVISGHVVIVINSNVRLEFDVPAQQMVNEKYIIIPNIKEMIRKQLGIPD